MRFREVVYHTTTNAEIVIVLEELATMRMPDDTMNETRFFKTTPSDEVAVHFLARLSR